MSDTKITQDELKFIRDGAKNMSMGNLANAVWKMMFEMPVIVPCEYCGRVGAVATICIGCGQTVSPKTLT